jgi:hypothetical protein
MGINFPNTPSIGQLWPQPALPGVPVYRWDGQAWMTGSADIIGAVRFDAAQTLTANQKAQARANIDSLKKNYILNGAMMVSQENGTTAGTTNNYYPVDQFVTNSVNGGAISAAQVASVTSTGSPNRVRITVTTADAAVAAGDLANVAQIIEGIRMADLMFGTANAKTLTLQFGVKAPAGTYCVSFLNSAITRVYVAEYIIAAGEANIDVVKSVTVPGETSGVWPKDNTIGMYVRWGLMVGSTYQQAAGSWSSSGVNGMGSANQFNFMGTVNNVFELFDVGLYEGVVAPTFQVPDYASELQTCQRYYEPIRFSGYGQIFNSWLLTSTYYYHHWQFHVVKRSVPTVTLGSGAAWTGSPSVNPSIDGVMFVNATAYFYLAGTAGTIGAAANARL